MCLAHTIESDRKQPPLAKSHPIRSGGLPSTLIFRGKRGGCNPPPQKSSAQLLSSLIHTRDPPFPFDTKSSYREGQNRLTRQEPQGTHCAPWGEMDPAHNTLLASSLGIRVTKCRRPPLFATFQAGSAALLPWNWTQCCSPQSRARFPPFPNPLHRQGSCDPISSPKERELLGDLNWEDPQLDPLWRSGRPHPILKKGLQNAPSIEKEATPT